MINGSKRISQPIRWAMVGGGSQSQIGYIHRCAALRDNTFVLVAGAFDIDAARGREFGEQLRVDPERCYADYLSLFEQEAQRADGIQAVSIATPNGTHYAITKAALEAGLHVVCEKPLCFTVEQAENLRELSHKHNRIVGVTYGYAGHQLIEQAREMIAAGELGEVRMVRTCSSPTVSTAHRWRPRARRRNGVSIRVRRGRATCWAMLGRTRCTCRK